MQMIQWLLLLVCNFASSVVRYWREPERNTKAGSSSGSGSGSGRESVWLTSVTPRESVSARLRHLDLALPRVLETRLRVDGVVHRSSCLESVRKSLIDDDLESAASNIQTFLETYSKFRDSAAADQLEQLLFYRRQLERVIKRRLSAAVDQRDRPTILRLINLFKPLGLEWEGLRVFVSYLKRVISARSTMKFDQLLVQTIDNGQVDLDFVACLKILLEDVVEDILQDIEEYNEILRRNLCVGEDGIVYAICELQKEYDARGVDIFDKYVLGRELGELILDGPRDPIEMELYLQEMVSLAQVFESYHKEMVSKMGPELGRRATEALRNGYFTVNFQGYYVALERLYMEENVRKAIQIDERLPNSFTTSVVDDVFYHVLWTSCRRAISTFNINSVIAVVSRAVVLLRGEYKEALQQNLSALLLVDVGVQETAVAEIATALNNLDVSREFATILQSRIAEQCIKAFPTPADAASFETCFSELADVSRIFEMALEYEMMYFVRTVTLRIEPVLASAEALFELFRAENGDYDRNVDIEGSNLVKGLLQSVENNAQWLEPLMTAANYGLFKVTVNKFIGINVRQALFCFDFVED